jgi:16S rRNA (adenine1518-N6/adenine1519-N6)-dimethyltransferase
MNPKKRGTGATGKPGADKEMPHPVPRVRAKKNLGQHFLRSKTALKEMVDAARVARGDIVLEVGPGRGVLTEALIAAGATVIAVETDTALIPEITEKFRTEAEEGRFALIEGDMLDKNVQKKIFSTPLIGKKEYKVVANIPYYITGLLFRLFLEELRQPASLTFLVQKEVAEQIVSRNNKESILSLSVKVFGDPKYIAKVPREAFSPPPKIHSAIVHVGNISRNRLAKLPEEKFFRVVKAGMSSRRKMLLGNLAERLNVSRAELTSVFSALGISPSSRGEDIGVDTWISLARTLVTKDRA